VHRIRIADPLVLPEAPLPIPPYTFGAWLGDGASSGARIVISDSEVFDGIAADEVPIRLMKQRERCGEYSMSTGDRRAAHGSSIASKLRALGVIGNKHIPDCYLRAGTDQRLELLRGIVDTDGYVSATGQYEVVSVHEKLAKDLAHLLATLGIKAAITEDRAMLNGVDCGARFRVQFFTNGQRIATVPRKVWKCEWTDSRKLKRTITSVEPVGERMVNCIQVDGGLYLAGPHLITTHNSAILSCLSLYMLSLDGEPGAECYTLATKKDQAKIVFGDAVKMIPPVMREKWFRERYNQLHFERSSSKLEPLSADSKKLDGLNPHFACADEIHEWPDRDLWDVIEDGMGARRQPLLVGITTAGHNQQSFCYTLRKTAVSLAEDGGAGSFKVDSFFGFIASADPEDAKDWRNPRVWAKANPLLGVSKRLDYMIQQIERCEAEPSKINTVLNKQLNLWTEAETRWISAEDWRRGGVEGLRELLKGRQCWGGLDVARVHDLSAFALVFPPDAPPSGLRIATPADALADKWKLLVWHWCPEEGILKREKRDRVPYAQWRDEGWLESTPGNVTDFAHLQAGIQRICADYQVQDIGFDRFFASETVQNLQGDGLSMVEFGQGFLSMASPTAELERMLMGGELIHEASPLMEWQAANVVTEMDPAGNLKPSKRKSRERIDGIVASIMALGRAKVARGEAAPHVGVMVV